MHFRTFTYIVILMIPTTAFALSKSEKGDIRVSAMCTETIEEIRNILIELGEDPEIEKMNPVLDMADKLKNRHIYKPGAQEIYDKTRETISSGLEAGDTIKPRKLIRAAQNMSDKCYKLFRDDPDLYP